MKVIRNKCNISIRLPYDNTQAEYLGYYNIKMDLKEIEK